MRREKGFTLIELMIAVVIIAILASIALPGYQQFIMEGRRSEGQTALLDIAARQEQFFMENHRYTANIADLGVGNNNTILTEGGWYLISATCVSNDNDDDPCINGYLLTATPQKGQAPDGSLSVNAVGEKKGHW